ncbi:MAG: hypothetical protein WC948_05640 [Thermovirgaceae bacterium]|jgi:hypothetical protein|nr:hypothetical protein [Thermovirga sp.]
MMLDFVKGHMGGNTITIIDGRQLPAGRELEVSLAVLDDCYLCSHEAGILYPGEDGCDLVLRIVGRASRKFISACGGLTQVLGKVLVCTAWAKKFGLNLGHERTLLLGTPAGITPIHIAGEGNTSSTETDMTQFLGEIYQQGIEPMVLDGIRAWRIGKFLVVHADELRKALPGSEVENLDEVARHKIVTMQEEFFTLSPWAGFDLALYDDHPAREGNDLRVIFPHSIPRNLIEPSCGTGSIAVCVAALEDGLFKDKGSVDGDAAHSFYLESGGGYDLGGPDVTRVTLVSGKNNRMEKAFFSHSNVEVTCEGRASLP